MTKLQTYRKMQIEEFTKDLNARRLVPYPNGKGYMLNPAKFLEDKERLRANLIKRIIKDFDNNLEEVLTKYLKDIEITHD